MSINNGKRRMLQICSTIWKSSVGYSKRRAFIFERGTRPSHRD